MFKKLLSTFLVIALVSTTSVFEVFISFVPKVQAAGGSVTSVGYDYQGQTIFTNQCENYKKNNDRTKVSNYPVKHYTDAIKEKNNNQDDPTAYVQIMQVLKVDKYCMQKADLEYSLKYIRDTAQREQVQAQIASVAQQENQAKETLRELQERQAKIEEFLAALRALAKDGDSIINKTLIDEKEMVLEGFHQEFTKSTEELKKENTQKAKEVKTFFDQFSQASVSEQQKMKTALQSEFLANYKQLKQEIIDQRARLETSIFSALQSSLNQEFGKFQTTAQTEFQTQEEITGAINAFKELQTEKKERFETLIKHVLDAATVQIDSISNQIERKVGSVDLEASKESFLVLSHMLSAAVEDLKPQLIQGDKDTVEEVEATLEKVEELKPLLQKVNKLLHSADFSLLQILDDAQKTQLVIQAIENDDHSNTDLIKILDELTDEQVQEIEQAYEQQQSQVAQMKESQEIVERETINKEEQTKEVLEEVQQMCSKNKKLTQLACNSIANIVREYGAFAGFLINSVENKAAIQKNIQVIEKNAIAAVKDLKKQSGFYLLSSTQQSTLKFELLASALEEKNIITYSSEEKRYKLQSAFVMKLKNAQRKKEAFEKLLTQTESVSGTSCKNALTQAIEEIIKVSLAGSCVSQGKNTGKSWFQKRLNALRKLVGRDVFVFEGSSPSVGSETFTAGAYVYEFFESENAVVQRTTANKLLKSLVYFDENNRAKIQADPVYVTFYKYDAFGRLVEKIKADPSISFVNGAWVIPAKWDSKVMWSYVGSSENIRERREFVSGGVVASKTVEYRYLADDWNIKNKGVKKIQFDLFEEEKQIYLELGVMTEKELQDRYYRQLLSEVIVKNSQGKTTTQNTFFYNSEFKLDFIEEKQGVKTRNVFMYDSIEDRIYERFGNIKKDSILSVSGDLDFAEQVNPILLMDADGKVLSEYDLVSLDKDQLVFNQAFVVFSASDLPSSGLSGRQHFAWMFSIFARDVKAGGKEILTTAKKEVLNAIVKEFVFIENLLKDQGAWGEFMWGFSERALDYGVTIGTGYIGMKIVVEIFSDILKETASKNFSKWVLKKIPVAGWGLFLFDSYLTIKVLNKIYKSDSLKSCKKEKNYVACGSVSADVTAVILGMSVLFEAHKVLEFGNKMYVYSKRSSGVIQSKVKNLYRAIRKRNPESINNWEGFLDSLTEKQREAVFKELPDALEELEELALDFAVSIVFIKQKVPDISEFIKNLEYEE